ncbi:MAG: anaerobic ribonucleoside-triphosphate reductase activating protein [Thermoplasmata archaeon]
MKIKGFLKTSFLDWDGMVVSVVFLPGCNLKCRFCHNWVLVEGAENVPDVQEAHVLSYLEENRDFLDGVCITGGEPCLHERDVLEFAGKVKQIGLKVKLDTNGTIPDVLSRLIDAGILDYIAMDVKTELDAGKYSEITGVDVNLDILCQSIELIKNFKNYEFRTTYIPEYHNEECIQKILSALRHPKRYVLQRFVPENAFSETLRKSKSVSREELEKIAKNLSGLAETISVRGV